MTKRPTVDAAWAATFAEFDAIRDYIEPGQVMGPRGSRHRRPMAAGPRAGDGRDGAHHRQGPAGRTPQGVVQCSPRTLIAAVRGDPAMTSAAISTLGAELGVWNQASRDDDKVVRERARRIRADADVKP